MVIGLTGGMGCGKSTVAGFLGEAGFRVEDTDRIVHRLLSDDGNVIHSIRAQFGESVTAGDGGVDRKALGQLVFADRSALDRLERLLHPLVASHWQRSVESEPSRNWVIQIPLLFEKNLEETVDFTVCVGAEAETQQHRLLQRGLTAAEISARLAMQLPLRAKLERADFFLMNNGSLDFLRNQVRCLANRLAGPSSFNF